jgi:hypothetical protein
MWPLLEASLNKTVKIIFGIFAVLILLMGAFAGGFLTRHALAQTAMFPGFSNNPHPDIVFPSANPVPPTEEQTNSTPGSAAVFRPPSGKRGSYP